jgi:hypothetical protein
VTFLGVKAGTVEKGILGRLGECLVDNKFFIKVTSLKLDWTTS